MILKPKKQTWSRKFLDLVGSAPDFPYPGEPPSAEPGPEFSGSGRAPLRKQTGSRAKREPQRLDR
jgi:hypothetical protein